MKLGKYAEFVRTSLMFHIKAWCLLVEDSALGIDRGEIERQLFSLDSGGRQWNRWKTGQIPSIEEFEGATNAAITCKWIDQQVAEFIKRSFSIQRATSTTNDSRSSWDQTIALGACIKYAEAHNKEELLQHCEEWHCWIFGPDESSPEFAGWLALKDPGWEVEAGEILEENINLIVWHAITQIYELGVDDPFSAIFGQLRNAQKEWPDVKSMLDEDPLSKRNRQEVPR